MTRWYLSTGISRAAWFDLVEPRCPGFPGRRCLSSAARAADAGKEIATVAQHAGYAAESTAVGMVHAHLQHTFNCQVGPQGDGFDAKQLNACKDFGDGAIPDAQDASKMKSLGATLRLAEAGLKSNDLDTAKKLELRLRRRSRSRMTADNRPAVTETDETEWIAGVKPNLNSGVKRIVL